jgi:hypothetical protein
MQVTTHRFARSCIPKVFIDKVSCENLKYHKNLLHNDGAINA